MPKAEAAALKALELDETLAEAHASLGFVGFSYDWDWPAAEREFKKAIDLNPGYVTTYHWYAAYLMTVGRATEGMAMAQRGLELDPLSMNLHFGVANFYCLTHQYEKAIEHCRKMLELDPDYIWTYATLEYAYYHVGMYEESLAASKSIWTRRGLREVVEALESGHEASGYKGAMAVGARKLVELSETRYVPGIRIAFYYGQAAEKDKAFEWLEKAYDERAGMLPWTLKIWWQDLIGSDPRFQDLLRRMNFPE